MKLIELETIGLSYYDIGVNKKIHTLICENIKCHITYEKVEEEKKFSTNGRKMASEWAGYKTTNIKKVPIKWEYNINSLIKFLKKNNKVLFRRKEVEFESIKYIELLKSFINQ